jgi:hypothetical protein
MRSDMILGNVRENKSPIRVLGVVQMPLENELHLQDVLFHVSAGECIRACAGGIDRQDDPSVKFDAPSDTAYDRVLTWTGDIGYLCASDVWDRLCCASRSLHARGRL